MDFYRINGKGGGWCLVNLHRAIAVDFDQEAEEFVFDDILRIKVDKDNYKWIRKDLLNQMFKLD